MRAFSSLVPVVLVALLLIHHVLARRYLRERRPSNNKKKQEEPEPEPELEARDEEEIDTAGRGILNELWDAVFTDDNYDGYDSIGRSISINAHLLNRLMEFVKPAVNSGIRVTAPDPYPAGENSSGREHMFSYWVPFFCPNISFDMEYSYRDIVGISDIAVSEMLLYPGSERLSCGFVKADWAGRFGLGLGSDSTIMINDARNTIIASCNETGFSHNWTFAGKILITEPSIGGNAYMNGTVVSGGYADIENATMPEEMDIDYTSVTAIMEESPVWAPFFMLEAAVSIFFRNFKEEVIARVEPRVRAEIENTLGNTSVVAPMKIGKIHAQMLKYNADNLIARLQNGGG